MDEPQNTSAQDESEVVVATERAVPRKAQPAAPAPDFGALVEQWFTDHFPGSAVARVTEAWNVVHAAKEDLKSRLAAL